MSIETKIYYECFNVFVGLLGYLLIQFLTSFVYNDIDFVQELKSSDLSETSLLSDITIDSITDIPCSVANIKSKSMAKASIALLSDSPSRRQFFPLKSTMLSPVQSTNIILSPTSEDSITASPSERLHPTSITANETAEEENKSLFEISYSKFLSHPEHDYCIRHREIPTFKEVCRTKPLKDGMLPFLVSLQPTTSYAGVKFSKRNLKMAGLTNINLEELVDTSSALLSVHDAVVDVQEKNLKECVRSRHKDFIKVMKIRDSRVDGGTKCHEDLDRGGRKLDFFDTDIIMKEIEFITDIIYCKYRCPSLIQRLLLLNFWQNRSAVHRANGMPSMPSTKDDSIVKVKHKNYRAQLAREMASKSPKLNSVKQGNSTYDNPPIEEISRSISCAHVGKVSLEGHATVCKKSQQSGYLQDCKPTFSQQQTNQSKESKDKHKIRANDNQDISNYPVQTNSQMSNKQEELTNNEHIMSNEPPRSDININNSSERSNDELKNWLAVSELWLSEPLNITGMLELLDEDATY